MLTPEVNLGNVTGMGDIINTIHLWGGTRWGPRRQTVMRIHSRGRPNTDNSLSLEETPKQEEEVNPEKDMDNNEGSGKK